MITSENISYVTTNAQTYFCKQCSGGLICEPSADPITIAIFCVFIGLVIGIGMLITVGIIAVGQAR